MYVSETNRIDANTPTPKGNWEVELFTKDREREGEREGGGGPKKQKSIRGEPPCRCIEEM